MNHIKLNFAIICFFLISSDLQSQIEYGSEVEIINENDLNGAFVSGINVPQGYTIDTFAQLQHRLLGTEMTVDFQKNKIYSSYNITNVESTLQRIDIATKSRDTLNGRWAAFWHPFISTDIEFYDDKIYTFAGNLLSAYNVETGVLDTLDSGTATSVVENGMARIDSNLYFAGNGILYKYNLNSGQIDTVTTAPVNNGIEYSKVSKDLFMASNQTNKLYKIDIENDSLIELMNLPIGHRSNMAISPDGNSVFIRYSNLIKKINLDSLTISDFITGSILGSNYGDVRFGPSSSNQDSMSLYFGTVSVIYEVKGFGLNLEACPLPELEVTSLVIDTFFHTHSSTTVSYNMKVKNNGKLTADLTEHVIQHYYKDSAFMDSGGSGISGYQASILIGQDTLGQEETINYSFTISSPLFALDTTPYLAITILPTSNTSMDCNEGNNVVFTPAICQNCDPCNYDYETLSIDLVPGVSDTIKANRWLIFDGNVMPSMNIGDELLITAGKYIEFIEGFEAKLGAEVIYEIEPCNSTALEN